MTITIYTPAHVSTSSLNSPSPLRRTLLPAARCHNTPAHVSALFSEKRRESRRLVTISLGVLLQWLAAPKDAVEASPFDKYVKRKQLDPLEAYVPAVLLAGVQIKELEKSLEVDEPKYGDCRNILRSGPASSLRVNIRAIAQYAADDGNGKSAFSDVDQCLSALEGLDSLLLRASRKDPGASIGSMKAQIVTALNALDSLLKNVPADVLDKGKAVADSYFFAREEDVATEKVLDPDLKQLESIL
ncbi:uncharacterized protein LOC132635982 isoform X1 [Lycium barbarum]|uniref:uncharacterized protein LOC132635982 isoform X1 n=2 Tax=Lycium barbarum TaxID=112863 RepID=UPI00293E5F76|nr:uncharacterized protein LOC132635982 isoform X1 [Lycium barbarum]XP_060208587.1 uncharacterized protein LOC132635982 isoform X1 [Lycium barbarum]XP_060208588.1 uncharacterized protein LOC132635982 isoform X1 [Lycium barbarum]